MEAAISEFYLSDRRTISSKDVYVGRVFTGAIRRGEYFQELHRIMASTREQVQGRGRFHHETLEICPVELEIQVIHFADRSIKQCDAGYTCGLELAGKGLELLRDDRSG